MAEGLSPGAESLARGINRAAAGQFKDMDRPPVSGLQKLKESLHRPSATERGRSERLWRETNDFLPPAPNAEELEQWAAELPPGLKDGIVSFYRDARKFREVVEKRRADAQRRLEQGQAELAQAEERLQQAQEGLVTEGPESIAGEYQAKLERSLGSAQRHEELLRENLANVNEATAQYPRRKLNKLNRKTERVYEYLARNERLEELNAVIESSEAGVLETWEKSGLEKLQTSENTLPERSKNWWKLQELRAVPILYTIALIAIASAIRNPHLTEFAMTWSVGVVAAEFASLFTQRVKSGTEKIAGYTQAGLARSLEGTDLGDFINDKFARFAAAKKKDEGKEVEEVRRTEAKIIAPRPKTDYPHYTPAAATRERPLPEQMRQMGISPEVLREAVGRGEITIPELAEQLGVPPEALSQFLGGRETEPRRPMARDLPPEADAGRAGLGKVIRQIAKNRAEDERLTRGAHQREQRREGGHMPSSEILAEEDEEANRD